MISFNNANGYEGSNTSVIFQDREDNLWFGTNGTGVFRYSSQPFLIFDQFTAERNLNVMPMLENNERLYIGTEGAGLFVYDGKEISHVNGISDNPADQNIIGLFKAEDKGIYILASSGLFAKYDKGKATNINLGIIKGCIQCGVPDDEGDSGLLPVGDFSIFRLSEKLTQILESCSVTEFYGLK